MSDGFITPSEALQQIWKIVHTPSKATNHRSAQDHFMADFDMIRRIIRATGAVSQTVCADCGGKITDALHSAGFCGSVPSNVRAEK